MTMPTLAVHDVRVVTRTTDPDAPIVAGNDGNRVVLLIDPDHAAELARIIAAGTTVAATLGDDDVWLKAITDTLAAVEDLDAVTYLPVRGTAL